MNQPQSNPLQQELARGKHTEPHPDDDVLTAFAEHALTKQECGRVLEHLSVCAHCREILSLTTTAMADANAQQKPYLLPVRPPLRSWLPWVATAAGLTAVAFAVVIHQRELVLRQQATGSTATIAKLAPPALPQLQPLPSSPEKQSQLRQRPLPPTVTIPPAQTAIPPAPQSLVLREQPRTLGKLPNAEAKSLPSMQAQYGNLPLGAADQTASARRLDLKQPPPPLNPLTVAGTQALASSRDEALAAAAAQPMSRTAPAFSDAAAAPAPAAGAAAVSINGFNAIASRTHWRINQAGQAERSFDNEPWRPVLPDDKTKIHVVEVSGSEVWLGGEHKRLYRSDDGGLTWRLVPLPIKGPAAHVITHIRFESVQAATVEADDGTQWTTSDGGQTWK